MLSILIHEKDGEERRRSFDQAEITIGRVEENDLVLPGGSVSKRHARLARREGRLVVTDLGSTNGTYVNGRRISQPVQVGEGDRLHLGGYELRVAWAGDEPAATRPPPEPFTSAPPSTIPPDAPWSEPPRERHGLALGLLMRALASSFDLDDLAKRDPADASLDPFFERAAEIASKLRADGQIEAELSPAVLCRDVHRELFELGPLGPLLDDPDISEIRVLGHDRIRVKTGSQTSPVEPGFSSENALLRAIARLVEASGEPLAAGEAIVTRLLPRGLSLQALLRPTSLSGPLLVVRKPSPDDRDLEDLVGSGMLSSSTATQLTEALDLGGNLLLVSPSGAIPKLGFALVRGERAVLLHPPGRAWASPEGAVSLAIPEGKASVAVIRSALRLGASRLLAGPLGAEAMAALFDALREGAQGVVLVVRAPSIEAAVERCAASLAEVRGLPSLASARSVVARWLDLAIEVDRAETERERVLRVVEARELSPTLG